MNITMKLLVLTISMVLVISGAPINDDVLLSLVSTDPDLLPNVEAVKETEAKYEIPQLPAKIEVAANPAEGGVQQEPESVEVEELNTKLEAPGLEGPANNIKEEEPVVVPNIAIDPPYLPELEQQQEQEGEKTVVILQEVAPVAEETPAFQEEAQSEPENVQEQQNKEENQAAVKVVAIQEQTKEEPEVVYIAIDPPYQPELERQLVIEQPEQEGVVVQEEAKDGPKPVQEQKLEENQQTQEVVATQELDQEDPENARYITIDQPKLDQQQVQEEVKPQVEEVVAVQELAKIEPEIVQYIAIDQPYQPELEQQQVQEEVKSQVEEVVVVQEEVKDIPEPPKEPQQEVSQPIDEVVVVPEQGRVEPEAALYIAVDLPDQSKLEQNQEQGQVTPQVQEVVVIQEKVPQEQQQENIQPAAVVNAFEEQAKVEPEVTPYIAIDPPYQPELGQREEQGEINTQAEVIVVVQEEVKAVPQESQQKEIQPIGEVATVQSQDKEEPDTAQQEVEQSAVELVVNKQEETKEEPEVVQVQRQNKQQLAAAEFTAIQEEENAIAAEVVAVDEVPKSEEPSQVSYIAVDPTYNPELAQPTQEETKPLQPDNGSFDPTLQKNDNFVALRINVEELEPEQPASINPNKPILDTVTYFTALMPEPITSEREVYPAAPPAPSFKKIIKETLVATTAAPATQATTTEAPATVTSTRTYPTLVLPTKAPSYKFQPLTLSPLTRIPKKQQQQTKAQPDVIYLPRPTAPPREKPTISTLIPLLVPKTTPGPVTTAPVTPIPLLVPKGYVDARIAAKEAEAKAKALAKALAQKKEEMRVPIPKHIKSPTNTVYENSRDLNDGLTIDGHAQTVFMEADTHFDGTYNFKYETDNGIQAQEVGKVARINGGVGSVSDGSYTFVTPDGGVYMVKYTANEFGFQATGDHLPTSPPLPKHTIRLLAILEEKRKRELKLIQ